MSTVINLVGGGVDTSDATAVANNIFEGKTAYADGEKVTGTFTIETELAVQEQDITQMKDILTGKGSYQKPKTEQEKAANAVDNGPVVVTPDEGKVLSKVTINVNVPKQKPEQEKTVDPTKSIQKVTPDKGKVLTEVTVNAIPVRYADTTTMTNFAEVGA